jgi:hypothetical protein
MKKSSLIITAASLAAASTLSAASGIFGSYVGVDANGGGNTFLGAQQPGSVLLTNFDGLNLGTFNVDIGDSLVLSGGEVLTFKNGGSDVSAASIEWRVNRVTPTASTGSFAAVNIGFSENATFADAASNSFGGTGDQKWASIASTPNVLAGLTAGTIANPIEYELEVFFKSTTTDGDQFSNNGGDNFTATFTVVPEPSSYALLAGMLGLTFVALKRRRA